MTEVKPEGEINRENVTRVSHSRHEAEEVMVFPVVVLEVLYNQHPTAVDKIHQGFLSVRPSATAASAPVRAP